MWRRDERVADGQLRNAEGRGAEALLRADHGLDVQRIVDTVFEQIGSALARGNRVELRGFGAFSLRTRSERVGRNPRTGDEVAVPRKAALHFKIGKELLERLNLRA